MSVEPGESTMRLATLLLLSLAATPAPAAPLQAGSETAREVPKAAASGTLRDPAFPAADIASTRFPPIDPARIDAMRLDNSAPLAKVLRIGVEREAALEAAKRALAPAWHALPGGGHATVLEVSSPGALALRSALNIPELPAGAEVRFTGNGSAEIFAVDAGEIAKVRESQSRYWSPVTAGDTQRIEVFLPGGADPRWARIGLEAASHLFVAPDGDLAGAKIGESDSCEFDAKCVTTPSQGYLDAKSAVARMVFQKDGGSFFCTGTLLNDTDGATQVPHFYSAAHCFTTQAVASTLTTFWFYETTGCGSGVLDGASRQVGGGSTVEFANASSDVLLVRLNNAPPGGSVFLGWNSASLTSGDDILVLHHPAGDVKKVSLGEVKGFGGSNLASGQFIKVGYTDGTTEGGSSGCGLLTSSGSGYQLRGGLLGGTASCANTGLIATAANSDDFSRFDQVFPSLQSFLAPAGSPPPSSTDYTGVYNNAAQSGWGLAVLRGATGTYVVNLYHYDQDNKSAWYLSTGALSGSNYSSPIIALTGPWFGIDPFNPANVATRVAGTISVQFTSETTANVSFTIDGRTVTTTVRKLAF
jgi:hypothetical protein